MSCTKREAAQNPAHNKVEREKWRKNVKSLKWHTLCNSNGRSAASLVIFRLWPRFQFQIPSRWALCASHESWFYGFFPFARVFPLTTTFSLLLLLGSFARLWQLFRIRFGFPVPCLGQHLFLSGDLCFHFVSVADGFLLEILLQSRPPPSPIVSYGRPSDPIGESTTLKIVFLFVAAMTQISIRLIVILFQFFISSDFVSHSEGWMRASWAT